MTGDIKEPMPNLPLMREQAKLEEDKFTLTGNVVNLPDLQLIQKEQLMTIEQLNQKIDAQQKEIEAINERLKRLEQIELNLSGV